MLKKTIATLLFSMSSILFISINCFGEPPPPNKCVKCHGFDIYDEWKQSKHNSINRNINMGDNVTCFDCHVSGKAVADDPDNVKYWETIILEPGEKQGFHILGYYDGTGWVRISSPKEVCLRCHADADIVPSEKQCTFRHSKIACHQCHMPVDGLKTYRLHEYNYPNEPIHLDDNVTGDGMDNNIAKYVTREHRDHKFPNLKRD